MVLKKIQRKGNQVIEIQGQVLALQGQVIQQDPVFHFCFCRDDRVIGSDKQLDNMFPSLSGLAHLYVFQGILGCNAVIG